jgi:hypothetical protein
LFLLLLLLLLSPLAGEDVEACLRVEVGCEEEVVSKAATVMATDE